VLRALRSWVIGTRDLAIVSIGVATATILLCLTALAERRHGMVRMSDASRPRLRGAPLPGVTGSPPGPRRR
jgi:hypothetical protein